MDSPQVVLPTPHKNQLAFIRSRAKRKIVKAGRRGGKTVGVAILAVEQFLAGQRILYGTPTSEQIDRFWSETTRALAEPIEAGVFVKNETKHIIELPGTEQRIRAKTCWNADTLRGDYCGLLMLDEYQLMNEDTWAVVGAPMLLDNNGDAIFIYTPPSLHSRSASKANNPRHASELYEQHEHDKDKPDWDGRWECFHFTSHDNPHLSKIALSELTKDMTALAIRQEIDAEDANEAPGALWKRRGEMVGDRFVRGIEDNRVFKTPFLIRVVVGVDPSGSSTGDACGIVGAGIDAAGEHYTLEDNSVQGSPDTWARNACQTYHKLGADAMAAEKNYGGEMVEKVIHDTDPSVNVILVTATRGKAIRAEPVSALTERGKDHMVGTYPELEDEMCLWVPSDKSPNRMDAKVWADTELGARPPASKLVDFASNEVTIKTDEERTLDIQHQSAGRVCPQCGKADFVHLTASGVYACAMCGIAVPERVEKVEVIP